MKRLLPLIVLALLAGGFFALGLGRFLSLETLHAHHAALQRFVTEHPLIAAAAFLGAYVLTVAISLPVGTAMTIAGGWFFGLWLGTVLSILGATAGAVILFVLVRRMVDESLRARAGPFLQRMADGFRHNAFSYLLSLRLIPLFPFWAVNLVPALLGIGLRPFAAATLIGIVPGTLAFTSIGDGLGLALDLAAAPPAPVLTPMQIALRVGLAALALLPVAVQWTVRWSRRRRRA